MRFMCCADGTGECCGTDKVGGPSAASRTSLYGSCAVLVGPESVAVLTR